MLMAVNPVNSSPAKGIFDHPMENGQFAKGKEENVPMGQKNSAKNFGILAAQFWFNAVIAFVSFIANVVLFRHVGKGAGNNKAKKHSKETGKIGRRKIVAFDIRSGFLTGYGLILAILIVLINQAGTKPSKAIKIDTDIIGLEYNGEKCSGNRAFYIEFDGNDFGKDCAVYFCYLSHFDEKYNKPDEMQLMKPFKADNLDRASEDEIRRKCELGGMINYYGEKQKRKALHGIRFKKNDTSLNVTNSFSNETFLIPAGKILIEFGNETSFLMNIIDKEKQEGITPNGMKKPPSNVLSSVHKMRGAFENNPGIWLTPLEIAFIEKSRKVHFYIDEKKCPKKILVKIGSPISGEKPNEISLGTDHGNGGGGAVNTTTSKPIPMPDSEKICKTEEVFVKPAIIRDRFLELKFVSVPCKEKDRDLLKCPFNETDYAVRVGCIECDQSQPWINELFLKALSNWIESKDGKTLNEWSSEKIDLKNIRDQQPINQIENGKYIYFPVPKEWIDTGVKMLAHDCEGYGIFVSAFKKEKMEEDERKNIVEGSIYDWEDDFKFLENCLFKRQEIKSTSYTIKNQFNQLYLENVPIAFGTAKIVENNGTKGKEPFNFDYEKILRLKFKYDMNDDFKKFPRRNNKYVIEKEYMAERKLHDSKLEYISFFELTQKMQDGTYISKQFFDDADVKATIYRMNLQCGDLKLYSTRIWSIQEVTYEVDGEMERKTSANHLQTRAYTIYGKYYPTNPGSESFRTIPFLYKYAK